MFGFLLNFINAIKFLTLYKGYAKLKIERSNKSNQNFVMNEYLIDQETLGQFIDELIKQKTLPIDNTEELATIREEAIKSLDNRITASIFDSFNEQQNQEFDRLIDNPESSPQDFETFFERSNLDIEQIISDTMQAFAKEFLGGQNNG